MSLLEYAIVATLVLIVFPLSIIKMKSALVQENIHSFGVWVFITSLIASLPFIVMTVSTAT